MKILLCSDNHSDESVLKYILARHPDADYYWHLGDSEFWSEEDLRPFISVKGNNDYGINLPLKREIKIGGHKFLLTHGTGLFPGEISPLARTAKEKGCDTVIFGHIHRPFDEIVDGVRLINPGSCHRNRGRRYPTYAVMNINDEGIIDVFFYDIDN